jgi:hypothetical protein
MEVFINKMRDIRKLILIEEAWKAIAREWRRYIKYLTKTVRKFFSAVS